MHDAVGMDNELPRWLASSRIRMQLPGGLPSHTCQYSARQSHFQKGGQKAREGDEKQVRRSARGNPGCTTFGVWGEGMVVPTLN